MSSAKFKRAYPYLSSYLEAARQDPVSRRVAASQGTGCLAVMAGVSIGVLAGIFVFGQMPAPLGGSFAALNWGVVGIVVSVALAVRGSRNAQKPRNVTEETLSSAAKAARDLRRLDEGRKLHKMLDPVAGQLLEAGAYHWVRVHRTLDARHWQDKKLSTHWQSLRGRAMEAADLAMAELLIIGATCVGDPVRDRKDDIKGVFEDFADLGIQDALRGLAKIAALDERVYTFTTPRAKELFEPGRALAERLKSLADEVESADLKATQEVHLPQGAFATESIDVLLGEFRAVNQAEQELEENQFN